jgi:hypothetical protein
MLLKVGEYVVNTHEIVHITTDRDTGSVVVTLAHGSVFHGNILRFDGDEGDALLSWLAGHTTDVTKLKPGSAVTKPTRAVAMKTF